MLLTIGTIICVLGLIATLWFGKRAETKERDTSIGGTMSKHRVMGNPAALVYIAALIFLAGFWILWAAFY